VVVAAVTVPGKRSKKYNLQLLLLKLVPVMVTVAPTSVVEK
jgi:hypothetical protein